MSLSAITEAPTSGSTLVSHPPLRAIEDVASSTLRIADEAHPWYTGVIGEREVRGILDALPENITVLHDVAVEVGGTGPRTHRIAHLVIGSAGVFTVTSRYQPGKSLRITRDGVKIRGQALDGLQDIAAAARRLEWRLTSASRLSVPVTPVIAFGGITHLVVRQQPVIAERDVIVLAASRLAGLLDSEPVLTDAEAARLSAAARTLAERR